MFSLNYQKATFLRRKTQTQLKVARGDVNLKITSKFVKQESSV